MSCGAETICLSFACLQGMVAKIMRSSTFEIAFPIPPFTRVCPSSFLSGH